MTEKGVQGYLVFHFDEHRSEYLAASEERCAFISGFKGSNAYILITQDKALCWTDGRYYLACERELEAGWEMQKMEQDVKSYNDWVRDNMAEGDKIGVDAKTMTIAGFELRSKTFAEKGKELVLVEGPNLVDIVWGAEQPKRSQDPVWIHEEKWAGESVTSKIDRIVAKIDGKADALLVSTLDDIAWTTNLRGDDIEFNPVFFSYMIVNCNEKQVELFVDDVKVAPAAIQAHLSTFSSKVSAYDQTSVRLAELVAAGKKIAYDKNELNYEIFKSFKDSEPVDMTSLIELMKASKNEVQQQGMRDSHVRDCAALFKYFSWLDVELKKGTEISECDG